MTAARRDRTDDVLVTALAAGMSHKRAAATAQVSESTVDRRLRDPEFIERVEAARIDRVGRIADRLQDLAEQSVSVLSQMLTEPATADATRARIALAVPGMALAMRELVVIEQRLAAVEQRLEEQAATAPRSAWLA